MTIQFFELASPEHVRSLPSETRIIFGMASPGSWIAINPNVSPIRDEIERLAPLGIERIQLDGICCYEAEIFNGTKEELLARRTERTREEVNRMEETISKEIDRLKVAADVEEARNAELVAKRYGWS